MFLCVVYECAYLCVCVCVCVCKYVRACKHACVFNMCACDNSTIFVTLL